MVRMSIIGDRRSKSGSLAMLAAMRLASSRVVRLVAEKCERLVAPFMSGPF